MGILVTALFLVVAFVVGAVVPPPLPPAARPGYGKPGWFMRRFGPPPPDPHRPHKTYL